MCGIVGVFERSCVDQQEILGRVRNAVHVMRHRGPDDQVVAEVAPVGAWGMCRLAIRDPSPAGRQPLWHGSTGVVFNGEIYNTNELRLKLEHRGHAFLTRCDTEVLLKAYIEFGIGAFGLFDGIFAVAVLDTAANEVVLARDEFGVKPLFVKNTDGCLAFGSEPKALEAVGALADGVDDEQLVRFLRYQYVPEPLSPWRNVRRVKRGTVEVYSLLDLRLQRTESFLQPAADLPLGPTSAEEWAERTGEAISLAVRRQMVSDRPLGVFLSGGVDSTLVSAYASELHPGLRAFGISVPGWDRDERRFMEEACKHLDVDLTIAELTEDDFDRLTDRVLETYDEPFADFSALPTMLVSEVAATELRVVLSGDGGDELFGGYRRYEHAPLAQRLGHLSAPTLRLAQRGMNAAGRGPSWMLGRVADEVEGGGHGYGALLALRSHKEAAELLGRAPAPWALAPRTGTSGWRSADAWGDAMSIDTDQYLPADIHTKVDRASMSVSLEARVPLLGGPVARLAEAMPSKIKMRDGVGKWPLKELLLRRGFTKEFVYRPKGGFSLPMSEWLRRAVTRRPACEDLLRNPPPPINRALSTACLDGLLAGQDSGHAVWSVLVLGAWLTRFKP